MLTVAQLGKKRQQEVQIMAVHGAAIVEAKVLEDIAGIFTGALSDSGEVVRQRARRF